MTSERWHAVTSATSISVGELAGIPHDGLYFNFKVID
ncbi:unnamed protein product [Callosobruchus maculatus]|uniref:Uncharacterized protein n=1 Tax=Callosobruchus maculatus TaxID=64391 RepID=A0A653C2Y1_CALMS|nr:unnamed protein product [Callosobruchus maculatus]